MDSEPVDVKVANFICIRHVDGHYTCRLDQFHFFFIPDENSAIFFFQWNQQQDKTFGRPQMSQWRARALKRNQTCKQRGGQNRIVSFKEVFPSYKIIIKWKEKGQPSSVEIGLHYSRSAW